MPYSDRKRQTENRAKNERSRRARGLCWNCAKPAAPGRARCDEHLRKNRQGVTRYGLSRLRDGKCVVPACENAPIAGRRRCHACGRRWTQYGHKRLYGVTPEQFAGLMEQQGNRCAICHTAPDRFHLDHDHATGLVRGLLCGACNRALGLFRDDPERLARAIEYLKQGRFE
jgi:hypothetical protein